VGTRDRFGLGAAAALELGPDAEGPQPVVVKRYCAPLANFQLMRKGGSFRSHNLSTMNRS
jgi:hypothetical protein